MINEPQKGQKRKKERGLFFYYYAGEKPPKCAYPGETDYKLYSS
jgi:hypothetical protein